jgi:methylated-DNA-[protein]-cysteine S-methyltransferase
MTTYFTQVATPVDDVLLVGDGERLRGLYLHEHRRGPAVAAQWRRDPAPFAPVVEQLEAYFAGERRTFDLPLAPTGTPFQRQVWEELARIPYGETVSYAELAARAGRPGAARAAGAANGRNPISIVLPCHRVVGSSGALTGYAGGMERKRWLLAHETSAA